MMQKIKNIFSKNRQIGSSKQEECTGALHSHEKTLAHAAKETLPIQK